MLKKALKKLFSNKSEDVKPVDNKKAGTEIKEYDRAFREYLAGNYENLTETQRHIFCDDEWNFDNSNVTLRFLCDGLGIDVPAKFEHMADEPQSIAFRAKRVKAGDICLIIRSAEEFRARGTTSKDLYELAIARGAKLVIMGKDDFVKTGLDEKTSPVILMDHNNERILRLYDRIKKQHAAKVVMLTGSIGKTTTKDICYTVVKDRRRTFGNKRNTNTPHQIARHLFYNTNSQNEVFIQESGAGYRDSVRFAASMLQPDIFILTNVVSHHLQVYKTFENIFKEKVSADDYMNEDGVIITNYDDVNIRNHTFKHKVVSFAIDYEDADYRALNIRQVQDYLTFDILEKATGKVTPININILGKHNAYNVLAAFVLAKTLGISEEEFQEDIAKYKAEGVRQNLVNVGGVYINLDCYNAAEESIMSMLKAGEQFEVKGEGKKYAVVGGENKLGKEVIERSEAFGKELAQIKMSKFLFAGSNDRSEKALNYYGDAASMKKTFEQNSDVPCEFSAGIGDIEKFLKENVKPNDLVLFKGVAWLDMPIAIDRVFGTSFSFGLSNYKEAMKKITGNGFDANLIEEFGRLEMTAGTVTNATVHIPEEVQGYPVFRLGEKIFENNSDIESVELGQTLMNIGEKAFAGCTGLKSVDVPGNVKVIESQAFANCTGLKEVTIAEGVTHIASGAFEDCDALEKVYLPESVKYIDKSAFDGCDNVTIACTPGTYAHNFVAENQIDFI